MWSLVFKNVISILDARKMKISGNREKAIAAEVEANILESKRASILKDARANADTYRENLIHASLAQADEIVSRARQRARREADELKENALKNMKEIEERLRAIEEEAANEVFSRSIDFEPRGNDA